MSAADQYLLITPCRDEAQYARRTLDSVLAQSVKPSLWVIVDDGSTDETPEILADYAKRFQCIRVVRVEDEGERRLGGRVIDAFYAGLNTVNLQAYDYLCKLDMDLELPPRYFEILLDRMRANPRIGTCSGKPYYLDPRTQALVSERIGDEMSVGASKLYRAECFSQIGGFVRNLMWDGIDCHRCRMHGWIACSWDDPELRFVHLRPMGSSVKGWRHGRAQHGAGQYFMGTGLVYMTASALYRMTRPPRVVGGAAMLAGYLRSMVARMPRYADMEFRRFLQRYQWNCLLHGKRAATMRIDEEQYVALRGQRSKVSEPASRD